MTDENEENDDEGAWLQLRPVEPLPSQCCGSGCSPCVFDLYHRELARWEAARASKDRSLLNGEEPQSCPSRLSPETFLAFRISAMDRLTEDTYRVRFAVPRNSQLGLRPGQHLILRGKVDDLEIQRAYTPISPANAEGYFEVLIKCYETGLMSRYVKSWSTGDTTFWRGPFGDFFYKPNQLVPIWKAAWQCVPRVLRIFKSFDPVIPLLEVCPVERIQMLPLVHMFTEALFIIAGNWRKLNIQPQGNS
ncbi:NADH-cytochrome b5 reductase-like isoform X4 [Canis lupus dingo]|uniref:NADH-cytochrome b5 reductase-like isoform X4 n=1 Tax=Canis lupus dingo TaxID=286419 RepID=UPI0020C428C1|nr:NADH-cytochrome b5 reductase-like isoform X4 [Canis lupus dingo]